MKPKLIVAGLTFYCSLVVALLPPPNYVVHERRNIEISESIEKHSVPAHHDIPVRIGLTQQNLDHGHDLLMDISDPFSPNYGRHYSPEQIIDLFAPSTDTVDHTRAWLESSGIEGSRISLSANKQWLQFNAKAGELESLLHTKYYHYKHNGLSALGCDHYHVPENLTAHVDYIKPGVNLIYPSTVNEGDQPRSPSRRNSESLPTIAKPHDTNRLKLARRDEKDDDCSELVTPKCLFKLYNITDGLLEKQPGNSIGVYETYFVLYSQEALDKYLDLFTDIPPGSPVKYLRIDGAPPRNTTPPHAILQAEANLDIQAIYPLAYPDTVVNYQVDDAHYERTFLGYGQFNNFLDAIDGSYCNFTAFGITGNSPKVDPKYPDKAKGGYKGQLQCGVYKPTKVISLSYGNPEKLYSVAYLRRQCLEWMKLGLQGTTITAASGDTGVNDANYGCIGPERKIFSPAGTRSCPYVTAVGGTKIPKGANPVRGVEEAATAFGPGGGFSNIFPRSKWQDAALDHYFENYNPSYPSYKTKYNPRPKNKKGRYNSIGRGYPDVSTVAQNYATYLTGFGYGKNGRIEALSGTSASAPLFGGIIARINNRRLAAGKSTVGFINPTLYAHPHMFTDITKGVNNPGQKHGCGTYGFSSAPGWDPVTGLGTPKYEKMLEVFLALP